MEECAQKKSYILFKAVACDIESYFLLFNLLLYIGLDYIFLNLQDTTNLVKLLFCFLVSPACLFGISIFFIVPISDSYGEWFLCRILGDEEDRKWSSIMKLLVVFFISYLIAKFLL